MFFLKSPLKYGVIASVFLTALISCEMDEQFSTSTPIAKEGLTTEEEALSLNDSARFRIGQGNLLTEMTFEGDDPLSPAVSMQTSTDHGFTVATNPVFRGSQSGRIELRFGDPQAHQGTRSEIYVSGKSSEKERWYSFAAYFPATDYAYDSSNEVINQWHQGGSPAISLRTQKDRFYIRTLRPDNTSKWKNLDLGAIDKNTWNEFVIHIVHSGKSDGLIEVWKNGSKVVTHSGPNNYDANPLPYWKVGVYKAAWNSKIATESNKRVIYFDNIRVGNTNASFEEMTPGSISTESNVQPSAEPTVQTSTESNVEPTVQPSPEPIVQPSPALDASPNINYSLIDAHLEKAVKEINDGETISLGSVERNKVNIQGDFGSNVQSVKFELKGASSHTYVDQKVPFALFGDDGNGNYYFGNRILPTGNYTLSATGYADANGQNQIGEQQTIRFTIIN